MSFPVNHMPNDSIFDPFWYFPRLSYTVDPLSLSLPDDQLGVRTTSGSSPPMQFQLLNLNIHFGQAGLIIVYCSSFSLGDLFDGFILPTVVALKQSSCTDYMYSFFCEMKIQHLFYSLQQIFSYYYVVTYTIIVIGIGLVICFLVKLMNLEQNLPSI